MLPQKIIELGDEGYWLDWKAARAQDGKPGKVVYTLKRSANNRKPLDVPPNRQTSWIGINPQDRFSGPAVKPLYKFMRPLCKARPRRWRDINETHYTSILLLTEPGIRLTSSHELDTSDLDNPAGLRFIKLLGKQHRRYISQR